MRIAATFLLVLGGLSAIGGVLIFAGSALGGIGGKLFGGVRGLVSGGLYVTMEAFVFQSAGGFRMVVDSRGRDIKHLMEAVRQLATVFLVLSVGFCLQLILLGVGLALRAPQ